MSNFLDPAILFFVLGVLAGVLKSNLEIPQPISRFLSLYLLMALGLKGGFALAHSGFSTEVIGAIAVAITLAVVIPLIGFQFVKRVTDGLNAAAVAATYGSVSAVTFITATRYLDGQGVAFGGHMAAAMALMESPAIIIAILLVNSQRQKTNPAQNGKHGQHGLGMILKESLTDGAQVLLLGAMLVGLLSGDAGKAAMQPFSGNLFTGMLAFFLLDMGLATARNFPPLKEMPKGLLVYAVLAPPLHATLALGLSLLVGVPAPDAGLLMVLAASASYIAVPAVMRFAVPEANPSLYFGLSLGVTFPINILIGIPLYIRIAEKVIGL